MRWPTLSLAWLAMFWVCLAAAAEPPGPQAPGQPPSPPTASPASPAGRVQEVTPPIYYVEDKSGKLVPMFGFGFEDFVRAFRWMQGLEPGPGPTPVVLERFSAVGQVARANPSWADLTVRLELAFREEGRFRVPLRLDRAVVRGPVQAEPDVQAVLEFEEQGDGYVCWVRGKTNQKSNLSLPVSLPVTSSGSDSALAMRVPPATRSDLDLTVAMAGAVGRVSPGATLQTAARKDQTQFTAEGVRGDFELHWRPAEATQAAASTVLEASGEILVRLDDQGVNTEATLHVRGHGAPLDRFQIRVPPDGELLAGSPSGYSLVELPEDAHPTVGGGRTIEARLAKSTVGPVTVRVTTRRPRQKPEAADWLELGGFEVVGAARQSGHIAVVVAGDLFVAWDPQRGVRQIETLPESLQGPDVTAGFEYVAQPCSLRARIVPRKTHLSVESEHLVLVDAQQASLEATLRYTVRGKKALGFEVALADWELDEVGPESVVAVDGAEVTDGLLTVPLLQPSTGQIELKIKAHRRVGAEQGALRLSFPRPKVGSPGPTAVAILPADNVRLVPDEKATVGLVRQQTVWPMPLPKRQQTPLCYRAEAADAVFVAARSVHAQAITVGATTQVALDDEGGRVEERLAYAVDYEPRDKLLLEVPRSLARSEAVEFLLESQKLAPTVLSDNGPTDSREPTRPVRVLLSLPEAKLGRFELLVRYPLAPRRLVPRSAILRAVPLVMPVDGQLIGNRVQVSAPAGFQLTHRGSTWRPVSALVPSSSPRPTAAGPELELSSTERLGELELGVYMEARDVPDATVVQRAWLRTWLVQTSEATSRQDRALLRFTTNRREVGLLLPEGVAETETEVFLDGKRVPARPAGRGNRLIPVPEDPSNREHLLEVRCHGPGGWTPQGSFVLQPIRLGETTWTRRAYWQITLPPGIHRVGSPPGFVDEHRWGWNGLFWGRQPLLDSSDLQRWMGAAPASDEPDPANTCLLSALGPIEDAVLRTANRSAIVLGASGAALVLGLLLLHMPVLRRGGSLWVIVVALAATTAIWPAPSLLALQAASLGLGLVLVAGLLQWSLARRRRGWRPVEMASAILERDSTQAQYVNLSVAGEDSVATTPPRPTPDRSTAIHETP